MTRKLFAAALFAAACAAMLYASSEASAVEEAPAPRAVEEKKPDAKGKFGGFDRSKIDPEKLKAFKEKLGGKYDPEKFKGRLMGKIDPEKLKELKEKFGKKDKEE